jgi:hypothetical protein
MSVDDRVCERLLLHPGEVVVKVIAAIEGEPLTVGEWTLGRPYPLSETETSSGARKDRSSMPLASDTDQSTLTTPSNTARFRPLKVAVAGE